MFGQLDWWLLEVLFICFVFILFVLPRWFREAGGIQLPVLWYLKPVICDFPRVQCRGESQENSDALSIISPLYSLPMFLPLIYFNWAESPLEMLVCLRSRRDELMAEGPGGEVWSAVSQREGAAQPVLLHSPVLICGQWFTNGFTPLYYLWYLLISASLCKHGS